MVVTHLMLVDVTIVLLADMVVMGKSCLNWTLAMPIPF